MHSFTRYDSKEINLAEFETVEGTTDHIQDGLNVSPVWVSWGDYRKQKSVLKTLLGEKAFEILVYSNGRLDVPAFRLGVSIMMVFQANQIKFDLQTTLLINLAVAKVNAQPAKKASSISAVEKVLGSCGLPDDYRRELMSRILPSGVLDSAWWHQYD